MAYKFIGYHGTSYSSAQSILDTEFNESNKKDDWLGNGVYFFVAGISNPKDNAKDWAIAQAWNSLTHNYNYKDYSVLMSEININEGKLIDLTDLDGLTSFNDLKNNLLERIFNSTTLKTSSHDEHNCILFNFMVTTFGAEAIKHHLYIKNTRERVLKLRLNVPNVTVLCVLKKVLTKNISQVSTGVIR